MSGRRSVIAAVLLVLLWALQPAHRGVAASFVVTNTNDAGPGSLRQAILDSNRTQRRM